ncbi:MAG TPA: DUF2934 domain-containing protein [Lichenihabitans sp.]|jgi:hypothetical protein|nr:DUF2934 domain-containing protein [Lichenihabitans sp.]
MTKDPDFERIRRKAHELWEAEGRPHGRDQDHWDQAREIIALEDSQASTLLPRTTGAEEPSEPRLAVDSLGDVPGLTDQGRDDLLDTRREPAAASAGKAGPGGRSKAKPAAQPTGGKVAEKPAAPKPAAPKPAMSKPVPSAQAAPKPGTSAPRPAMPPAPSVPPAKPSTPPGPAAAKIPTPAAKGPAPIRPKT